MSTIRHFNGSRETRKRGPAAEQMMFEIKKKGKLPAGERYKRLLNKKLQENREKVGLPQKKGFSFSDKIYNPKKMSARAEQALKEIAMKKAAKLAKAEREMVIVAPKNFSNGSINRKGQIFDVAGNVVAKVNLKNGKMATNLGTSLGKYKARSYMTEVNIQNAINLHSPYFIQQRRLQQLQQMQAAGMAMTVHGPMDSPDTINVFGQRSGGIEHQSPSFDTTYGSNFAGPRQNIGVTAWGAMSDNVWGTYSDNIWGQSADNVWGMNSTDVWGGIGVGGLWGTKDVRVWGTGTGKNYIKGITNFMAALFGLKNKGTSEKLNAFRGASKGSGGSRGATMRTTRSSAPAPRSSR